MTRNEVIRHKYKKGVYTAATLAKEFGISYQRVFQIIYVKPRRAFAYICLGCSLNKETFFAQRKTCEQCYISKILKRKTHAENWKQELKRFGLSCLPEGRERTRTLVRVRDNFTCQDCGDVRFPKDCGKEKLFQKQLDVHHLNGLCGKRSRSYEAIAEMEGLITLCHKCHFNRHDWQPRLKKDISSFVVV